MTDTAPLSPTYYLTKVADFLDSITERAIADGLPLQDIRVAHKEISEWAHWPLFWSELACRHWQHGSEALTRGSTATAGEHFSRASLCAHFGQFLFFDDLALKARTAMLKIELFRRAAPLLSPPAEPVEVPWGDRLLPGFLRIPAGDSPRPCVVLVGGLDAAKEDARQFSDLCVARGLATLAIDSPGQGEALYRGQFLRWDVPEALAAAVTYAAAAAGIDGDRIALAGRSLGGFLVCRTAASTAVRACLAWGALYNLDGFERKPPLIRAGYRFITDTDSDEEAVRALSFVDLGGWSHQIECPLFILHGGRDNSVPVAQAERLARETAGPTTLVIGPDSIHCNHDQAHIVRPQMADWLRDRLTED